MEFLIFLALVVIAVVLFLIQLKLNDILEVLKGLLSRQTAKKEKEVGDVSTQEDETSPSGGGGPR